MSAVILRFPQRQSRLVAPDPVGDFLADLQLRRRLGRQHRITGSEWLRILDLEKAGMPTEDAALQIVESR